MTSRHVALLRGINVGKAKRVAMADLRTLVEGLGYEDVATLLNSGNVVFSAPGKTAKGAAERIQAAIAERLGVSCRVTVLSAHELDAIMAKPPFGRTADDPSRLLVCVVTDPADEKKLLGLKAQKWHPEAFAVGPRAAYLWCAGGILESPALDAVSRALRDGFTSRNWTTLTKLRALAARVD